MEAVITYISKQKHAKHLSQYKLQLINTNPCIIG